MEATFGEILQDFETDSMAALWRVPQSQVPESPWSRAAHCAPDQAVSDFGVLGLGLGLRV